jgi:hypothetical protein
MVGGRHPFGRQTAVETMNAILNAEPFSEDGAQRVLPPGVQVIAGHCLEKDPHHRFQSAQDIEFDLGVLSGSSGGVSAALPFKGAGLSRWWPTLRVAVEVLLLLALGATLLQWRRPEVGSAQVSAAILPPPGEGFWAELTEPAAISPDGKFLAIVSCRTGNGTYGCGG